ncbi:MAG: insulinase family protein [Planctomycetes bacterium]|nr:insulinase family protein [Planctomycetota bacterium]
MVTQPIHIHRFENGLVLLAEPMQWLESAAFSLLVPAGCNYDPLDQFGLANLTCEMVQRGCGSRDSRQFVNDLELLGADTSASVSNAHTSFGGAMPADRLLGALAIYSDVVRRPHLPEDQLEDARLVCIQEIRSLEDDLPQKVFQQLRQLKYGDPYGRNSSGEILAVQRVTPDDVRRFFDTNYRPDKAILSVAGKIDWPRLRDGVGELFADWQPRDAAMIEETPSTEVNRHIIVESSQTHIGIAYSSVPYSHPDYFQARGAVGVLSDGMSSRLFTEVRENRGLAYAVYATCHSLRDRGSVLCYAGTSTERAQETLDVLLAELTKLAAGVQDDELQRLKAKIKSALVMQQESSSSRSSSIAADWYHLGRVYTLDELGRIVDGLSPDSINHYLAEHPPRDFTIVTLGAKTLEIPLGVSSANPG